MYNPKHVWQAFGSSVRGALHGQDDQPNQDSIHWQPVSGRSNRVVLAVADGHSGGKHLRSARGAYFAAYYSCLVLENFLARHGDEKEAEYYEELLRQKLPGEICLQWATAVANDLRRDPFSPEEEARLMYESESALQHYLVAYGTTLAAVAIAKHYILCLQLGDGDLVGVSQHGESRHLVPQPQTNDHTTDSLCLVDAPARFRSAVVSLQRDAPVLILLSTDGYSNSFASQDEFLQVGGHYLNNLREAGMLEVSQSLDQWLQETSQTGSGEDITVGMLYRLQDYHAHQLPSSLR